jgi:hypothetical protein
MVVLGLQAVVDCRYFLYPALPLRVLKIQQLCVVPVKVIGNEGYLLIQRFQGIA